ncbi:MAG TPA: hypothetical protein VEW08_12795, partial [Steroidobacteraceae bacterium]|nr:hypothetical protein [Steroidobacteraceae bacterium]
MNTLIRAGLIALAIFCFRAAHAQEGIPPALREWQAWVLHGEEFRRCPFTASAAVEPGEPIDESEFRCVWPERLTLAVDARGGTFSQRWQVYSESWVQLPGDSENWPREVRLNGAPAAVVAVDDAPNLRLTPGSYTLSGRFEWSSRPESLALPDATAIVDLFVDGSRVAQPERPDGGVWLGKRRSTEQAAAMEVQVYRLVQDEIPAYLLTRIRLNVAGEAREEVLGRALPDGFTPLSLQGDLPARLERDGTLRVQLRAGSHEIFLYARGTDVAQTLSRPENSSGKWPKEEVWSFAPNDSLRVAAAEGAEGIDPAQANVPAEWRQYPAFRMDASAKLTVVERSRGLSNADDNRLTLSRAIWLDFDHRGFTAVDQVNGLMRRNWRLDMQPPFALQSARQGNDQLLVTEGEKGRAGVELREPRLNLTTVARKETGSGAMPATGWDSRFDRVSGTLNLPAGHRLIAAIGTDGAPGAWWERWGLWNVFGVLLIVGFVYWTGGLIPAAIAALALLLTYQELPEFIWLWGNLLAALAIARAAPAGRFQKFASAYRTVSFVVLGIALLPFLWMQIRYALYPQLAPSDASYGIMANARGQYAPTMEAKQEAYADAAAPAADAAAPASVEADAITAEDIGKLPDSNVRESLQRVPGVSPSAGYLNSVQVVQRYAAGTVLQAGPGIPAWGYNSYSYYWSGPVESADTVRFIYVGPVVLFFWRLLGVFALAALFAWLALLSYGKRVSLPGFPKPASATALLPGLLASSLLLLSLGMGTPAHAASEQGPDAPANDLLTELKTRLTAAPKCAPDCAEISAARVTVEGDRLEVVLQVSALASVAVAMPHASDRWQLDDVSVDARGTLAMARDDDASLWVPLTAGAHTVRLAGRLAAAESIQLAFPQRPRVIDVSARGWTTSGVNEGRLVSGSLELARERDAERSDAALEAGAEFPAFVRVDRLFSLDLDWTLDTIVTRIAPQRAALSVEIPLVKGESVLTDGVKVRNNEAALVGLGAGERQMQWHSGLARAETLEVSVPADAARSEVWSFFVNPQWNVVFEGFAPVLPENVNASSWVFRFMPRPGEKLTLKVTRPKGAKGTTLAIDSASLHTTIGSRSSSTTLQFAYRSTQGGRHVIQLPEKARVTGVTFDGRPQQLRPEKGELPLSLAPGEHSLLISWEESRDVSLLTHPSTVDLRSAASNLTFGVALPDSRWVLAAWGPGIGPAVLYWGELVVFIVVAWLLGRWANSPLRFTEWLLLGLGLSTQSWFVFCLTAAWLIAMRWREGWKPGEEFLRWRFNAVQVVLAVFTFITILTLVFSGIRNGLLAYPDMHITGRDWQGGGYT